jgi:glycolate oxidase
MEPMPMDAAFVSDLRASLRPDQVLTSAEDLSVYAYDGTAMLNELPGCVVLPEDTAQVSRVVALAQERRIPVVTRGSGTGLSGGSVPSPGSLVLCLVRMNRVLEVDCGNLAMQVEAGVTTQKVAEEAEAVGLFYPPDPGSNKISTIGGNVANNSGGLRGLKYGVTRDYVMAMEVVLADGQVLRTGTKCVKDVAGFTLKDLFIGSEGTLGVITQVTLKLIPPPADKRTLLALFDSMTDAAATISAIIAAKIIPCTLEFLDQTTIECVEGFARIGLPLDAAALLLVEVDGHPTAVDEQARAVEEIARRHRVRQVRLAESAEEATRLATARRSAFSALARLAPTVILEDVTVPRSELERMVAYVQGVAQRHRVRIGTFGHMGDGNLHPTFLTNERDREEMGRVEAAMKEVFEHAVQLGGTITGEHGVGLAKKPFLAAALGPVAMDAMRRLKAAFDPHGILNPGKVFD